MQVWRRFSKAWCVCSVVFGIAGNAAADSVVPPERTTQLPSTFIEIPSHIESILIADAEAAELVRFTQDARGLHETDRRYMSVGRNGVGKQRAWDRKTPLGVYFLTEELDTQKLAAKYGRAAFVMDYPNAWDRYNERTGDGIWLHGVDPRSPDRPRRDTDGCLALPNDALLSLAEHLQLHATPLIVARRIEWRSVEDLELTRRAFRAALEDWRDSLALGDAYRYLALYSEDFSARGLNKAEWVAFKLKAFAERPIDAAKLDDVLLLRDPEVEDLYISRFALTTTTGERSMTITKRLYWRRGNNEAWRIVAEDAG